MAWFWSLITVWVIINVVFVLAALVRSVIRDRKEAGALES